MPYRDNNRDGDASCLIVLWFLFCLSLALGVWGVIIWAIIRLVNTYT